MLYYHVQVPFSPQPACVPSTSQPSPLMRPHVHLLAVITLMSTFVPHVLPALMAQPAAAPSVTGTWLGTLTVPGGKLRIVFHISEAAGGKLTATLDSPDQGATGIPASAVSFREDTLHIEVEAVHGAYEGRVAPDAGHISGAWVQGGARLPLDLARTEAGAEALAPPPRPQEPKPPLPYRSEDVSFENTADNVRLAGTLTLPQGSGPFPAVALISGSGPQDRNETLFGHKPFLILADYLTRHGIAVLRYDDRGVGESTGDFSTATSQDFARDAEAAVQYLLQRSDIQSGHIGLIGHSEGAMIAPMVANRTDAVSFLVLLAPPAVPGDELLREQAARIMRTAGATESQIQTNAAVQRQMFDILKNVPDSTATDSLISVLTAQGMAPEAARAQAEQTATPWFRYFLSYDPRPALRKVDVPILALYGSNDLQVPPDQNLPQLESALATGGTAGYTIEVLPGLNHLFQTAPTGIPQEYGQIEETFAPTALKEIGYWITAHTGLKLPLTGH